MPSLTSVDRKVYAILTLGNSDDIWESVIPIRASTP